VSKSSNFCHFFAFGSGRHLPSKIDLDQKIIKHTEKDLKLLDSHMLQVISVRTPIWINAVPYAAPAIYLDASPDPGFAITSEEKITHFSLPLFNF
jgi:hypothetical protein